MLSVINNYISNHQTKWYKYLCNIHLMSMLKTKYIKYLECRKSNTIYCYYQFFLVLAPLSNATLWRSHNLHCQKRRSLSLSYHHRVVWSYNQHMFICPSIFSVRFFGMQSATKSSHTYHYHFNATRLSDYQIHISWASYFIAL